MAKAMYLHVPFCDTICAYCDFARCKSHPRLEALWLKAIADELNQRTIDHELETIYLGGGTPSALSVDALTQLLSLLVPYASKTKEYTVEGNVENLSAEKLSIMKKFGVNRISLGVQTFQNHLLKLIERKHTKDEVKGMIQKIHEAGIHHISIDLMYALPTQTMEEWETDLLEATQLKIDHLSLYSLTIEPNSTFGRKHFQSVDNELEGEMYEKAIELMQRASFHHYEVSNFARSGGESLHNQMYWDYEDFYGIGVGASGKEQHVRYTHPFRFDDYVNHHEKLERIELSEQDERFERIMMGLRMAKGIDLKCYQEQFGIDLLVTYQEAIDKNREKKWLSIIDNHIVPTEMGMCFLNEVLLDFMD